MVDLQEDQSFANMDLWHVGHR